MVLAKNYFQISLEFQALHAFIRHRAFCISNTARSCMRFEVCLHAFARNSCKRQAAPKALNSSLSSKYDLKSSRRMTYNCRMGLLVGLSWWGLVDKTNRTRRSRLSSCGAGKRHPHPYPAHSWWQPHPQALQRDIAIKSKLRCAGIGGLRSKSRLDRLLSRNLSVDRFDRIDLSQKHSLRLDDTRALPSQEAQELPCKAVSWMLDAADESWCHYSWYLMKQDLSGKRPCAKCMLSCGPTYFVVRELISSLPSTMVLHTIAYASHSSDACM